MPKPHSGELDHLSAEYLLIRPSPSSPSLSLTVHIKCNVVVTPPPSESPIKGVLIPVKRRRNARRGTDIRLDPRGGGLFEGQYTDTNFWQDGIDEALLLVVNPTWGENTLNAVQYELSVM